MLSFINLPWDNVLACFILNSDGLYLFHFGIGYHGPECAKE